MSADERGFTLVEVLVALVVSALLLAVVMDGSRLARDRADRAAEKREGVLLASHLLRRAAVAPFVADARTGSEGDLEWRLTREAVAADPRGLFVLARIAVEIRGRGGRPVFDAETRRLLRPQEA